MKTTYYFHLVCGYLSMLLAAFGRYNNLDYTYPALLSIYMVLIAIAAKE